ncbi:MAG TPA: dTMP kinase [Clostridia bacterium]|nr:dTMP kinase [Clostridia bacterium]
MGKLITLEGPEGAGKTTQSDALLQWLVKAGYDLVVTREPGGTDLGRRIRHMLLDAGSDITDKAEILLYAADRAQHVEKVIIPALRRGRIVLCDRYIDSTTAYQGYARGLGTEFVEQVNRIATGGLVPDLTLIYDIPPDKGMARKKSSLDRLEQEDLEFHRLVREGYLMIARKEPSRVKVINALNDIETVTRESIEAVKTLLRG